MSVPAIKDVMTKAPITIDAGDSIMSAAELMKEKHIRHLPVMKAGRPVGVLNWQQVLAIAEMYGSLGPRTSLDCGDIKSNEELYTTSPDTPLDDVCREMAEKKLSAALVLEGDKLTGIFTLVDACRYIASL
jgi:CBS domain-containing protein